MIAGGEKNTTWRRSKFTRSLPPQHKKFLNSAISDVHKVAEFSNAGVKIIICKAQWPPTLQYMRIQLKYFTQEMREEYNIMEIAQDGYLYIEIRKGMYGLKEAEILSFN